MDMVAKYLPVLLGFAMIIAGIINIIKGSLIKKYSGMSIWISIIISVALMVAGIFVILRPTFTGKVIGVALGLFALFNGISNLVTFASLSKKSN